jgi:epidermal growth factor receptor substrate 15
MSSSPNWFTTNFSGTNTNPANLLGGGLAGAIPTTSSGTTSGSSTGQSSTVNSNQLSSLLSTLSQISGATQQSGTSAGTTTGGYASPGAQQLNTQLASQYAKLAAQPTNLQPYEAQQQQNINQSTNATSANQQAAMAARGLSTSPVSGAVAAQTAAQGQAQSVQLQQSLPLLQQQLLTQNLGAANSFLANAPKTQQTTGTQTQAGTQTQTGNTSQTGTQTQNGSSSTVQAGSSNTATNTSQGGGIGGLFQGLGTVLASL